MRNTVILVLLISILANCSNERDQKQINHISTIKIKPGGSVVTKLSEFASEIKYVKLETTSESMIGHVSRFYLYKDKYYIWDGRTKSVLCFNQLGKLEFKLDRKGKGPGEYIGVNDFYIDKNKEQLVLWDLTQQKILRYTLIGDFYSETTKVLFANQIISNNKSSYWFYTMGDEQVSGITPPHNLLNVKLDGKTVISSHFPFKQNTDIFLHRVFNYSENNLIFWYAYCDTIYKISDSAVMPFVFVDFNQSDLTDKLVKYDLSRKKERDVIIQGERHASLSKVIASKNFLFFSYANSSWLHKVLYSFTTNNLCHIRLIENDIDGVPMLFKPEIIVEDKAFVLIDPITIIESNSENETQKIKTFKDEIDLDDNPIIAIITLKQF